MAVDYAALKKGGFMRQKQKNNFSLRLQVVGGNLTAENLKKIAEVAEKYGDGHVHLTSRQSVEIPFVKLDDVEEVKEELAKGGCKPGVCGPRVRTVTACQGNQICPSGNIDTYDIAKKLDARYYARELPHKFKFGVTGCQNNCLKAEENDVGIKGAMVVEWDEPSCIMCGSRRAVRARSPWRTARSSSTQTNVTIAVDAQRHVLQMHGRARQDTLSHSEDYLVTRSTAARSYFRLLHLRNSFSVSQMRQYSFLQTMQSQASVSSLHWSAWA